MEKVLIFDTTLRDGEQSPGASLTSREKLHIALQLERLGVDVIEAGFPVSSEDDARAVALIGSSVKKPAVCALARCRESDIAAALRALRKAARPRLHLFLATSEIHRRYKLGKAKSEIVRAAREAVRAAARDIDDIEFSPEDASRTEPDFLAEVCLAVAAEGARTVNIPDTVGYALPWEFGNLIATLRAALPRSVCVSVHCHNDLGLAVASSLAAVASGARQVECTVNGIGERAGNAALEEIVMALRTRQQVFGVETGIRTEEIFRTSRLVSSLTGIPVQPNKAIVGENAFRHEAGIHQDGVLKRRETYEIMDPRKIGIGAGELVLGKHSGRHALRNRLEKLGFSLSDARLEDLYRRFKQLADRKKTIEDLDLIAIADEATVTARPVYEMVYFHIVSGSSTMPSATISIRKGKTVLKDAAHGDGPVDALYRAIDRVTGLSPRLSEYRISAITGGKDAQGEVAVCLEIGGQRVVGKGVSTDIIEASAKAYLAAINIYLAKKTAGRKAARAT